MSSIREAALPGVGQKFQIETAAGDRVVIVIHDDGRRELYIFERRNLDRAASTVTMQDGEARQIAGILGGLYYVPKALPSAEIVLDELVLEWYTLEPGAACIGKTIREFQVRTVTGASIVTIIEEDGRKHINPEADTVLNAGATLIMAGDRSSLKRLKELLTVGRGG